MELITLFSGTAAFYLALILTAFPSLSNQELGPGSKRFSAVQEATGDRAMLSPLLQLGVSTSGSLRHSTDGSASNVTLENLSDSLSRLEDNLSSLIQSFLTVQRSVLNLEQLQELLVLLLEDILKQTGNTDRTLMKDANPAQDGAGAGGGAGAGAGVGVSSGGDINSGDTSLNNSSQDSDSSGTKSTEINEDGVDDSDVGASPGGGGNVGGPIGRHNGRVAGSNVLAIAQSRVTHEGMLGLDKDPNAASSRHETDTSQVDRKDDSDRGSSEERNSDSNENYSEQRMLTPQRSTQAALIPLSSSQKPKWSEPQMERTSVNTHPRFYDVMQRIASRLGQTFAMKSSPRLQELTQVNPAHRPNLPESTFEQRPIYEPLEIVEATRSISKLTEKRLLPNAFPLEVKLRQEPVISHGGPLTGPEQSPSLYLEQPENYRGIEGTGERPTGMINNLILPNASQTPILAQPDYSTHPEGKPASPIQSSSPMEVADIRRKRHAYKTVIAEHSSPESSPPDHTSSSARESGITNISSISQARTLQPSGTILNTRNRPSNDSNTTENSPIDSKNDSAYSNSNRGLILDNQIKQNGSESSAAGAQEYDAVIANLMNHLRSSLYQHHLERKHGAEKLDSTVHSELNDLVWMPSERDGQSNFPKIQTQAASNKTPDYDGSSVSSGSPEKRKELLSMKPNHFSKAFSETLHSALKLNPSLIAKDSKITSVHKATKKSDIKARPLPVESTFKGTVNQEIIKTSTPSVDGFTTETVVTEEHGLRQVNITSNTYAEWEWLHELINGTELPQTDRDWLVGTLLLSSLNESVVADLRNLSDRWRTLVEGASPAGGLKSSADSESVSDMDSLSQFRHHDIYDDTNFMSLGDSSSSSEEDDGKIKENLERFGKTVSSHRTFGPISKLFAGTKSTNGRDYIATAKSDTDYSEESDKLWRKSVSNEDDVKKDEVSDEGQEEESETVKEIDETISTDIIAHTTTSTPHTGPKTQNQVQDLPPGLPHDLLARDGQTRIARPELNKRHRRSWHGIKQRLHDFSTQEFINLDHSQSKRTKRQASTASKVLHISHTKSLTDLQHLQTHENVHQQANNESVHSSQTKFNITHEEHQNITQSKQSISQNPPHGVADQTPGQNETNVPLTDPTSSISNLVRSDSRNLSQPNNVSAHATGHTDPLSTDQTVPVLESFQLPFNGMPPNLDPVTNNNHHAEHPGSSSTEPGGTPSVEEPSVMDLEDILSSMFMTYWRRFYNLYTRSAPQPTPAADWDVEEEVSDPTLAPTGFLEGITVSEELASNVLAADPGVIEWANTNFSTSDTIVGQL